MVNIFIVTNTYEILLLFITNDFRPYPPKGRLCVSFYQSRLGKVETIHNEEAIISAVGCC